MMVEFLSFIIRPDLQKERIAEVTCNFLTNNMPANLEEVSIIDKSFPIFQREDGSF